MEGEDIWWGRWREKGERGKRGEELSREASGFVVSECQVIASGCFDLNEMRSRLMHQPMCLW